MSPRPPWGLVTEQRPGLRSLGLLVHRRAWHLYPSAGEPRAGTGFAQSSCSPCRFPPYTEPFSAMFPSSLSLPAPPSLPRAHNLEMSALSLGCLATVYPEQKLHLT